MSGSGLPAQSNLVFLGREAEIREIVEHCRADRLVVLVSQPGFGASTLLKRGLTPALKHEGFITVNASWWQGRYFRTALKDAIADAVREQADETFFGESESLGEMLARIRSRTGRKVGLLFDQFEDYLRCQSGSELSDSFDTELADAISGRPAAFVIAIQEHALRSLERLSQLIPNLLGYRVSLSPLSIESARDLVRLTAAERGISVEPAVTEALISASPVSVEGRSHPFFLTCGLHRLLDAETRLSSGMARLSTLEHHGGAERLVLESHDEKIRELNTTHVELFFRWCNVLISPAPHRRLSVTEEALTQYSGKFNRFVLTLLPILTQNGLIRSIEMPDGVRYELARESLVPIVRDWWERREAALIARSRAAFRVRSVSVAVGSIVTLYVVWLLLTIKK